MVQNGSHIGINCLAGRSTSNYFAYSATMIDTKTTSRSSILFLSLPFALEPIDPYYMIFIDFGTHSRPIESLIAASYQTIGYHVTVGDVHDDH